MISKISKWLVGFDFYKILSKNLMIILMYFNNFIKNSIDDVGEHKNALASFLASILESDLEYFIIPVLKLG